MLAHVGANAAPGRDVFSFDGPAHRADHAAGAGLLAGRLAIDATEKVAGELAANGRARLDADREIARRVTERWAEYQLELAALCGETSAGAV